MDGPTNPANFVFDQSLDAARLTELYEDDLQWIEDIFQTTLEHFGADVEAIRSALEAKDAETLRRAIHKMKPTFGYVGASVLTDECQRIETALSTSMTNETLTRVEGLLHSFALFRRMLESEYERLKNFNNQSR